MALSHQFLCRAGHDVVVTREPGGTPAAEQIRQLLISPRGPGDSLTLTAETLLFFASRAQHVEAQILPALQQGKIVLCDRFTSSTVAFQCFAQHFPLERMRQIQDASLGGFRPDLTIILDIDPAKGLARNALRGEVDRIETVGAEKLEAARQGFLWQAQHEPEVFTVINADRPREDVFRDVRGHLMQLLSPAGNLG